MPTAGAIRSAGTLIKNRISGVLTLIPDAQDFDGLGGEADDIEITPLDNTSDKEYLTDLADPGVFSFKANYVPGNAVHKYLIAARKAGTVEFFEVTFVSGDKSSFNGIVKGFKRSGARGAVVTADVSVKITGAITDP